MAAHFISTRVQTIYQALLNNYPKFYNYAPRANEYNEKIVYQPPETAAKHAGKPKKVNGDMLQPPDNMNTKTNIAEKILKLLNKHFPANHSLHKVFNRNNVKVSYSCMPNTSNVIKAHDKKSFKDICPLKGECLTENIVYLAKVKSKQTYQASSSENNEENSYFGRLKIDKLYKHSLRHRSKANATELARYVGNLRGIEMGKK